MAHVSGLKNLEYILNCAKWRAWLSKKWKNSRINKNLSHLSLVYWPRCSRSLRQEPNRWGVSPSIHQKDVPVKNWCICSYLASNQTGCFRNHSSSFVKEYRKQRPIERFLFQQFLFFLVKYFFCISKPFFYFGLFFCIHNAIHFLLNSENFVKENLLWLGFSYTCLAEFFSTVALEMTDTPQMGCFWKLCFPATEWLFFSVCDETFCCS